MNITVSNLGPLVPHLLDLAAGLQTHGLRLVLVGGFGLVLRQRWRAQEGAATLIAAVPESRSTDDFDVLLRLEVLADKAQRRAYREVLTELGYEVLAENYQFKLPGSSGSGRKDVKVDFLAPLPATGTKGLVLKPPRVGATNTQDDNSLHGRVTPEAVLADAPLLTVPLEGVGSDGSPHQVQVDLPHPYTLLLMKLHAFRDEQLGRDKRPARADFARKHAGDLYRLIALLDQTENDALPDLRERSSQLAVAQDAARIVAEYFSAPDAPGIRLVQQELNGAPSEEDLTLFTEVLADTFR